MEDFAQFYESKKRNLLQRIRRSHRDATPKEDEMLCFYRRQITRLKYEM